MPQRGHRFARFAIVSLTCGLGGLAAAALTVNPINSSLPLSIHVRARCENGTISYPGNVGNITDSFADMPVAASCSGAVTQANPATLSSVFGTNTAAGALGAGTLGVVAIGRSYSDATQSLHAGSGSTAFLYDTLTVNGSWTGVRNVELRLTFHGRLTTLNAPTQNWISSNISSGLLLITDAGTLLGSTGLFITVGNNGVPFITSSAVSAGTTLTTNAVNTVFDPNDIQFTMTYVFGATTSNRRFSFMGRIDGASGFVGSGVPGAIAAGAVDFANGGQFSLIVPSDVTVTSASGQFLQQPATTPVSIFPYAMGQD